LFLIKHLNIHHRQVSLAGVWWCNSCNWIFQYNWWWSLWTLWTSHLN